MPKREGLRARMERQLARDDTRRRHWMERRENRIVSGLEDPVLPALCRICLIGMLGGALMAFTGDLASGLRGAALSAGLLRRAASSALAIWLLFGVPLIIGCAIQLRRGFDHPWFQRHILRRSGRARMPWAAKYRLWIRVAAVGAALWLIALAALPR